MLLLSHIPDYKPKEIKDFLNRFSPKPVKSYYLDILIAGDFLTAEELQVWLPVSRINSYREILPWLKKMISKKLTADQKQTVIAKLRKHFPSDEKARKEASSFLALHYLKTDQITEIFQTWNQISSAFSNKNLALEFFEKSFNEKEKTCTNFKSPPMAKKAASSPLLKFIEQCCQILNSKTGTVIRGFKPPASLRSSALAKDFVFLVRIQNKTLWLEKGIAQLQNKTSQMIMNLKASITKYQKREWSLKELATKSEACYKGKLIFLKKN